MYLSPVANLPPELAEWLPEEIPPGSIRSWALVSRSFDRRHGEALLIRRSEELLLLTRSERFEPFRALPLGPGEPISVGERDGEAVLEARTIDGRTHSLSLLRAEREDLLRVLASPPRASRARGSDRPSTIRPPESAELEVVRIPWNVRPAAGAPGSGTDAPRQRSSNPPRAAVEARRVPSPAPPRSAEPGSDRPSSSGSVHPPAFASEPAPIVRTARDLDALRASFRHHWDQGALDEASQVARALAHLGVADAMERRLANLQPEVPPGYAVPLSPYIFRAFVAHDEEDADLGRLLAALWPAYLQMRVRSDRELGLRPRDEVDLTGAQSGVARLFAHGARALSLDRPRFFLRTDVPGGMAHLHAWPLASLCGGTLATGFDEASTLHVLGHHLSFYRHEAYLVAIAPAQLELEALVLAALHVDGRLPAHDARVASLAEVLARHMAPQVREAVRGPIADLRLAGADPRAELCRALRSHRRAAHLTAVRAGFALSGSLAVSDRMQRMMPAVPGVSTDELIDDLITYSVSPAWSALRKELGIAMEPSGAGRPPIGGTG